MYVTVNGDSSPVEGHGDFGRERGGWEFDSGEHVADGYQTFVLTDAAADVKVQVDLRLWSYGHVRYINFALPLAQCSLDKMTDTEDMQRAEITCTVPNRDTLVRYEIVLDGGGKTAKMSNEHLRMDRID
jgi:hypothetical protein